MTYESQSPARKNWKRGLTAQMASNKLRESVAKRKLQQKWEEESDKDIMQMVNSIPSESNSSSLTDKERGLPTKAVTNETMDSLSEAEKAFHDKKKAQKEISKSMYSKSSSSKPPERFTIAHRSLTRPPDHISRLHEEDKSSSEIDLAPTQSRREKHKFTPAHRSLTKAPDHVARLHTGEVDTLEEPLHKSSSSSRKKSRGKER